MKARCVRSLKQPLVCSFVLNLVIALLLFLVYDFHWETNDDVYMSSIAYGTYGQYDEHLIFINIIIGRAIKYLLTVCPRIPWYGVLQTILVFISFVIIVYRILENCLNRHMITIVAILIAVMGIQFYVQMQFTKTAGITSIAGILLILKFCAQRDGKYWMSFVVGNFICVIGMMYRAQAFYLALGVLFVLGVYELVFLKNEGWIRRILRYGLCALLLLVMARGLSNYNAKIYSEDSNYTKYMQFNAQRAALMDYYWPDYASNSDEYDRIGISKEDIEFYNSWNIADKELVNTSNLQQVNSMKKNDVDRSGSADGFVAGFVKTYFNYPYFIIIIVLLCAVIVAKQKIQIIFMSILSVITILLQFYLYYNGRAFISRIDDVFAMEYIVALLIVVGDTYKMPENRMYNKGLIIVALFAVNLGIQGYTDGIDKATDDEKVQWVEYLNRNSDKLFLMENWTNVYLWDSIYSIWSIPVVGLGENVYTLGGWQYQSPNTNKILENYNIRNPFEDMVGNNNVLLVSRVDLYQMRKYMERHYYQNLQFECVEQIGNSYIYKVTEVKND